MKTKIDTDNLVQVITENQKTWYRLAYSYVNNKDDAMDIIQDSICRALSSSSGIRNPDALKSWFYRIVINCSMDFLRKNGRYICSESEIIELASRPHMDTYEDTDLIDSIEKLSSENRTIITLRYFESMKIEEIADILNKNVNTVKSALYSSLKKLRMDMQD